MIARVWHGVTPKSKREGHVRQIKKTGLKDFARLKGNRGAYVFTRDYDESTEFLVISLWDSMDSIKAFAGDDMERSRYYPDDYKLLANLEPKVKHYRVEAKL